MATMSEALRSALEKAVAAQQSTRPARQGHVRRPAEADISGPQGKSEDQPHAKQIAPAEGVTPPAEVHACPTLLPAGMHIDVFDRDFLLAPLPR